MYKNCRKQYHRWSFRLSVLGKYVDAGESYDDELSAGVAADLAKHHLRTQYRLDLPASLDGEMFSSLAYSRRNVDLNSSYSVESALAPGVLTFIAKHKSELETHRDSQPGPSDYEKFRNSGMVNIPAVRDWIEKCEAAHLEAQAFAALNSEYFFRLIDSLSSRLIDAVKPVRLAQKMHEGLDCCHSHKLASRKQAISDLITHLESDIAYARVFAAELRAEQATVETAVVTLENNRPNFS